MKEAVSFMEGKDEILANFLNSLKFFFWKMDELKLLNDSIIK